LNVLLATETGENMMETIQIQLPPALLRRIRQEATSNETLSQLIAEAVQMWLTKKRKKNRDLWDVLEEHAGSIEGPKDWSVEHDHYLYGTPKRSNHKTS
jgi:hypothetical protein